MNFFSAPVFKLFLWNDLHFIWSLRSCEGFSFLPTHFLKRLFDDHNLSNVFVFVFCTFSSREEWKTEVFNSKDLITNYKDSIVANYLLLQSRC